MGVGLLFPISLAIISVFHPDGHSSSSPSSQFESTFQQLTRPVVPQSPNESRYYFDVKNTDYESAKVSCETLPGNNYRLASIQTERDLLLLNEFLSKEYPRALPIWVGGIYFPPKDKWYWETLIDPRTGNPTAFSSFANKLFKINAPHPHKRCVTSYRMITKDDGALKETDPSYLLPFVCELS